MYALLVAGTVIVVWLFVGGFLGLFVGGFLGYGWGVFRSESSEGDIACAAMVWPLAFPVYLGINTRKWLDGRNDPDRDDL